MEKKDQKEQDTKMQQDIIDKQDELLRKKEEIIKNQAEQIQSLKTYLENTTNLLRLTVGMAITANPDVPQLYSIVDQLYKAD